ncbi:glycosyltransferase family 4 protein [Proteiniphilum acetatigenes]|uniref:glycosyltransferase family 4 protein n=1 Tax=Proteiniphilum acetatigenes TaxID=294710 RepID=UPI00037BC01E|nr:glycosyltransferase family 4 protein [Proteiniphilum acetatigenes]
MQKILRITTVSVSLNSLLNGQLRFLSGYYEVIGVASGEEELKEVSEREGIRTVYIPMRREICIRNDLKSIYLFIRLFRKEQPDIVHANTPKASLLSMVAAKLCGVPHRVYTVTGLRFETATGSFRRLLILMEKITCACATKVIPEGNGVASTLRNEKITRKPLKKILNGSINGIDCSSFSPALYTEKDRQEFRRTLGIQSCDFVFIFVGRLVKDKGINELVASFCRLEERYTLSVNKQIKNLKLVLVGSVEQELDPLEPETLETIQVNSNIISVGFQKDVRPYFAISDALVFPSYREGFPNVVMQAGAMGLPSIVTDINGCNEIIIEGKNGVIIPPKNEQAIYDKMLYFLDNPEEVNRMTSNARECITSRYEQRNVWEALLKEYQSLTGR